MIFLPGPILIVFLSNSFLKKYDHTKYDYAGNTETLEDIGIRLLYDIFHTS